MDRFVLHQRRSMHRPHSTRVNNKMWPEATRCATSSICPINLWVHSELSCASTRPCNYIGKPIIFFAKLNRAIFYLPPPFGCEFMMAPGKFIKQRADGMNLDMPTNKEDKTETHANNSKQSSKRNKGRKKYIEKWIAFERRRRATVFEESFFVARAIAYKFLPLWLEMKVKLGKMYGKWQPLPYQRNEEAHCG